MSNSSADNINSPSYLSHYGMHRPPFADKLDDDMYFSDAAISQRLDILTHLTQYSKELLLVIGTEGIGKTTLMGQFLNLADPTWKICRIDGNPMLDEEQLLLHISHGFHLPVDVTGFAAALKNLKRRLEALLATTQTVVLIIDDAHQINDPVLGLILEIAKIVHTGSGGKMRTILCAESSIQTQLAASELDTHLKDQAIRKIDLLPNNEEQTQAYILYRLTQSGIDPETALNDATISKIHRLSAGIPSQINLCAHTALYDLTPLRELSEHAERHYEDPSKSRKLTRITSALVIGLALLTLLLFQNEINELYNIGKNKNSITQTSTDKKIINLAIPNAATSKSPRLNDSASPQVIAQKSEKSQTNHAVLDGIVKLKNRTAPPKPTRQIFIKPNYQRTAKAEQSKYKAPFIKKLTRGTQPYTKTLIDKETMPQHFTWLSNLKQAPWIMEQDPSHFTLQLVAGYQRSSIDHFIELYPQLAENLGYFASVNKGKHWHSLVYGIYPNYITAITAAKELAGILGKHKPWIRQIKSIQKDINS